MSSISVRSPEDAAEAARRRLPHFLYEYIRGGAYDEVTVAANRSQLRAVPLEQRVMRDVSAVDTRTTLLGRTWVAPIALGPVGLAGMCAPRGEVMAARAAATAGIPFCLSTVSVCDIDEVARAAGPDYWFQLYMIRDRAFMRDLLARAQARCSALVFTVDMPVPALRYRDFRSGMSGAPGLGGDLRRLAQALLRPRWCYEVGLGGRPHTLGNLAPVLGRRSGMNDFAGWMLQNFDPSVTWADLDWVRQTWKGPLIIKGIMAPQDARAAADIGADAIVVSNHGGRQLDGAPATAAVLPDIVREIAGRLTVLVDGGVRSGLDVLRMLSLGADGVLLGRAWVYALATGGEAGVAALITAMTRDLRAAMAMTGTVTVKSGPVLPPAPKRP